MTKTIPQDWRRETLGSICRNGGSVQTGPFGSQLHAEDYVEDGTPIITVEHLSDAGISHENLPLVSDSDRDRLRKYSLESGDLVFSRVGAIDRCAIVSDSEHGWLFSGRCLRVRLGRSGTDPTYLGYLLNSWYPRQWIVNHAVGSTMACLNTTILSNVPLYLAPESEQSKIAEILSTVDRAIEQTEALIAKQQRIKTGLMQDLLTRGIDEQGNLRSEQTHQFKDSPLGRIPEEWEISDIQSLLADVDPPMRSGPFGSSLLKEELVDSGVPYLGIDNVYPEKFVREFRRFVSPKKANQLHRYRVRPRDLMITIMGTVGRCCVVPDDIGEALSSKHVWTISLDPERYSPFVACLQFNHSPWVLNHFAKDEQGGIMSSIRSETLRSTKLPVPPPEEMEKIDKCLQSICNDLQQKTVLHAKLSSLKTALMQDLLTGEKRVTPLLDADVTEDAVHA